MSTRAIIRFATRESGVSFSEHPKTWHAQFYKHHDGYVEALGLDIVNSILDRQIICEWEIENLYVWHDDVQYCYYIWQHFDKDTWVSIFRVNQSFDCDHCNETKNVPDKCIFVGTPEDLQKKINDLGDFEKFDHKLNTNNCR
tara:strand:+ start:1446 stop:1871 length:426 start_codon:yes stop_codon:yes gene_type:complete